MSVIHQRLHTKLVSFDRELDFWADAATREPFDKHASQITRINNCLSALSGAIKEEIDALPGDDSIFKCKDKVEKKILQALALLGFFREKFMLRSTQHFVNHLISADDFSWECFEPFRNARIPDEDFNGQGKNVPPLVYYSHRRSPAVLPRDRSYGGMVTGLSDATCLKLAAQLPVSIISMPWYQSSSLPGSVILAHEIGHVVEFDLGLSTALDTAFEDCPIPESRKAIWRSCRVEAFADAFGAAVCGSAYCLALCALLRRDKESVVTETIRDRGRRPSYPTRTLRMLLAVASLTSDTGSKNGTELMAKWRSEYGREHAHEEYEQDVPLLAEAFVRTVFPQIGGSIAEIGGMKEAEEKAAMKTAKNLKLRIAPTSSHVRTLVNAAQHAFVNNPADYNNTNAESILLEKIVSNRAAGTRSVTAGNKARIETDYDQKIGRDLSDLLG